MRWQVWLQITRRHPIVAVQGFVVKEVSHRVKDATVKDHIAKLYQLVPDGLDDMTLATSGRCAHQHVDVFPEETACCQVVDFVLLDRWIETLIEFFQALQPPKGGDHPPVFVPG